MITESSAHSHHRLSRAWLTLAIAIILAASALLMPSGASATVSWTGPWSIGASSFSRTPDLPPIANAGQPTKTTMSIENSGLPQNRARHYQFTWPTASIIVSPAAVTSACNSSQFVFDTCPAASQVGTVTADSYGTSSAHAKNMWTGTAYRLSSTPSGAIMRIAIVLRSGYYKARLYDDISIVGGFYQHNVGEHTSSTLQIPYNFPSSPSPILRRLSIALDGTIGPAAGPKFIVNRDQGCGNAATFGVSVSSWSASGKVGTTASASANLAYACPPETTITNSSLPGDRLVVSMESDQPGSTFQCQLNGGAWFICPTPFDTGPLPDGNYQFCARAVSPGGTPDPTPSCIPFVIETPPDTAIVSVVPSSEGATITMSSSQPGSLFQCRLDGDEWFACANPYYTGPLVNGVHMICVRAVNQLGLIDPTPSCASFITDLPLPDTTVTSHQVTDDSVTISIESDRPGSTFECQVDSGGWAACSTPFNSGGLSAGVHTVCARAVSDGTRKDPTPACISEVISHPNATFGCSSTQAASHPDCTISLTTSGSLTDAAVSLPDGLFLSVGSVPHCAANDFAASTCAPSSTIGSAVITTFNGTTLADTVGSLVALDGPAGNLGAIGLDVPVPGHGSFQAVLPVAARESLNAGLLVKDPLGQNLSISGLPQSVDGLGMSLTQLALHLVGTAGAPQHPALTIASNCEPSEFFAELTDATTNTTSFVQPFEPTGCASVPFSPTASLSYSAGAPANKISLGLNVAVPTGSSDQSQSSIRSFVTDLPQSIQPNFGGFASPQICPANATEAIPPACPGLAVGTTVVDLPMLAVPLAGAIYLEESGNPFPNIYVVADRPELGLVLRWRLSMLLTDPPSSRLRLAFESDAVGSPIDAPDVPLNSLSLQMAGGTNGPLFRISTDCRKLDSASTTFVGWSGAVFSSTNPYAFDPSCPN
ncbi:MAG: hypothetical protein JHC87_03040 [Thermoleophilaceae bacterium]|nr:hypothetical protein [Thermoleophilaceae bacterium]